jgi:SAM-dependent methyltransferase
MVLKLFYRYFKKINYLTMAVIFDWNEEDFNKLIDNCESEPVTPFLHKYLTKEGKTLEAGCGSGRFVYYLNKLGYNIRGIELNADSVQKVNRRYPELRIDVGDVTKLPFKDETIDFIISLGVIEHVVEGIDGPIKEMYRTLKPGGIAFVIVPSFNLIRQIKLKLGILHTKAFIQSIKDNKFVRRIMSKPSKTINDTVPSNSKYKSWPLFGKFYEYRFRKHEFENELRHGNFQILESIPVSLIDGIYHEFGKSFVKLSNHTFKPNKIGNWLNNFLSKYPFTHNHMHLCIIKK